jgi:predicted Zn-dependent peptidase
MSDTRSVLVPLSKFAFESRDAISRRVLENGLRVVIVPMHDVKSATALLLFPVGSRSESERISGISHLLEHMTFKGTKRRPTSQEISKTLDSLGAEYNAFTTKEYTGYYVKTTGDHLELALDILSDITLCSLFDADELKKEKQVVFEEIKMYRENPVMYIEEYFEKVLYGKDPLGREIAGDPALLAKLQWKDISDYHEKHYLLSRAVLVIAGNCVDGLSDHIEKYFGKYPMKKRKERKFFRTLQMKKKGPVIDFIKRDGEQLQLGLGFPAFGYGERFVRAEKLLSIILGGNMSSRLFLEVREKRGLAYIISCSPNFYRGSGNLFIHAGVDARRSRESINAILDALWKVRKEGITNEELHHAKEYFSGKVALSLEDSETQAQWYGRQEIFGESLRTADEEVALMKRVSSQEVHEVAKRCFSVDHLTISAIGQSSSLEGMNFAQYE